MKSNRLDLSDRIAIEAGLCAGKSFTEIASKLKKSTSTVSREVKQNREYIRGQFFLHNDCVYARNCKKKNLCDEQCYGRQCVRCNSNDCRTICLNYRPYKCTHIEFSPYVCNGCHLKRDCTKNRYIYSAKFAEKASDERRSVSRTGIHTKESELNILNEIVSRGVKKGQPIIHIYDTHKKDITVSLRTIYNYIDNGVLSVKNIDLRRKVRYKKRKPANESKTEAKIQGYRIGRTYLDYQKFMLDNPEVSVVQMDTVKGKKDKGPVILTMLILKYQVLLLFLLPDCTSNSVINIFDFLSSILGLELFQRIFSVILTDNGPEFKKADELENDINGNGRCLVFYCDPMASWQKGELEKAHEYIRYVIPKGNDLKNYTDDNIHLLMNHINSVKRFTYAHRSPYELVGKNPDMKELMRVLKMDIIPPDDVHLKPTLFNQY